MINIITAKTGTKYGSEYVNKLRAMVERHFHLPYRFICLTDDHKGLDSGIEFCFVNDYGLDGWWNKILLFSREFGIQGRIIWLDLDTVIVDDMTFLADYDGRLAMLKDVYWENDHWGSGIMCMQPNVYPTIWKNYVYKAQEILGQFHGDQEYISEQLERMGENPDLLQELYPGKLRSYKVECESGIPAGTAIVFFHGHPMPHEADASWIQEHWTENVDITNTAATA